MKKSTCLIVTFFMVILIRTIPLSGIDYSMKDLSSLSELQNVFQNDAAKVRIVALLSPT